MVASMLVASNGSCSTVGCFSNTGIAFSVGSHILGILCMCICV